MDSKEWKEELADRCDNIIDEYALLIDHIKDLDKLSDIESIDNDDISGFMLLKLTKLNNTIEKMVEVL